jgi:hypothetical protein
VDREPVLIAGKQSYLPKMDIFHKVSVFKQMECFRTYVLKANTPQPKVVDSDFEIKHEPTKIFDKFGEGFWKNATLGTISTAVVALP